MRIKRISLIFLSLALILTLGFVLVSCGDAACTEHVDSDSDDKCDTCGEPITPTACTEHKDENGDGKCDSCNTRMPAVAGGEFIKDGTPDFQFVVSANGISGDIRFQITQLADSINSLTSGGVEIVNDIAGNKIENEVFIGTVTSRGEEYALDGHDWGHTGWAIKVIGSKIVVVGGSDDAIGDAISALKRNVFGIKASTKTLTDLTVTAEMSDEKEPPEYTVQNINVGNTDMRDMVISYTDGVKTLQDIASNVQHMLYISTGMYLDIVKDSEVTGKAISIRKIENFGEGTTAEGSRVYVDDGNLVFETEFTDKFVNKATEFMNSYISTAKNSTVSFDENFEVKYNVRDIYYSDFGAKGDGYSDDFEAIKATHDYANKYGHTVHADGSKTYYIGVDYGNQSIKIRTDTYWHGAKFIFDDSKKKPGTSEWDTPRFVIDSENSKITYNTGNLPIASLESGASNIGFAPGYRAMVVIYDERAESKMYFRYGILADDGDVMHELVMVDADGNIDPSTPVQWDYTTVTKLEVLRVDDRPITVSGADGDGQAIVETIYFQELTETYHGYSASSFMIRRSNVTFKSVYHLVSDELLPGETSHFGASYDGFTNTSYAENVTFENLTLYRYNLASYHTNWRSYEITATLCNNITWRDSNMSNFFDVDGSVRTNGMMGTNYSKNMYFDNVHFNTFDAHRGSYNVTVENSTLVYLSITGAGKLTVRNTVFYTTRQSLITHAIWLREDYGSTFWGDVEIDGVELKYSERKYIENGKAVYTGDFPEVSLISAVWHPDHYFGYETSLPVNLTINNVKMTRIDYGIDEHGKRWEMTLSTNEHKLWLFPSVLMNLTSFDAYRDKVINSVENLNPYKPCETITITNCGDLKLILPETPQFKETVITVDGEIYNGKG